MTKQIVTVRNHSCVCVYSSDNEVDMHYLGRGFPEYYQRVSAFSHCLIPAVIKLHDPYRYYLNDDSFDQKDIVYMKIIGREERAERIWRALKDILPQSGLRVALRPQSGLDGCSSLYFYAADATVDNAKKQVLEMMREEHPELKAREIISTARHHSEYEAIRLLHTLGHAYEPLRLTYWIREKTRKEKES